MTDDIRNEITSAMLKLGYPKKQCENILIFKIHESDDYEVYHGDMSYFGIWNTEKKTFVD